jgi:hypothetical protein
MTVGELKLMKVGDWKNCKVNINYFKFKCIAKWATIKSAQ